jgi:hypothetical protein
VTTVRQVRTALAEAITAGCGLRAFPYVADTIPAPCAQVFRREMDPRMVFSKAKASYQFGVRVFWPRAAEVNAQQKLDEFTEATGAGSLVGAIEDGDNWTVDVDYASVILIGETQTVTTVAGEEFLTVDFDVEVVF